MLGTLRALTQVLLIWWTKDRIRVARSDGKLLRIHVGDRLLVEDKLFHVLSREESDPSAIAQVVYTLAEDQADSDDVWSLTCTMQSEWAILNHKSESRRFCSDQINLLAPTGNQ